VEAMAPPNDIGDYIRGVTNFEFLKKRYGSRSYNVVTPYSPFRLIGFPGMVMDKDLPTVAGKIVNIQSNLSADGVGTSTITFSHPRMYFDQEVDEITQTYDPFANDDLNDLIDNWPNVPFWLDNADYGVNAIAETLSPMVYSNAEEGATINRFSDIEVENEAINSRVNTRIALQSMQQLRILHKQYADVGEAHTFIDNETKRDLVTESNFWSFLIGEEKIDHNDANIYKDAKKMKYNPRKYKKDKTSSRLTNLSEFNSEAKKTAPFVLQRRDQVLKSFEDLT